MILSWPTSATYSRDHSLLFLIPQHCTPKPVISELSIPLLTSTFTHCVLCYPHSNIPPSGPTIISPVLFHCLSYSPYTLAFLLMEFKFHGQQFLCLHALNCLPFCPFYLLGKPPNLIRLTLPTVPTQLPWWKKNI